MNSLILLIILAYLSSVTLGMILILRPDQAIEFQKQFYLWINWRIEPVNMPLEIRNTRIMGFLVVGVVMACIIYTIISARGNFGI